MCILIGALNVWHVCVHAALEPDCYMRGRGVAGKDLPGAPTHAQGGGVKATTEPVASRRADDVLEVMRQLEQQNAGDYAQAEQFLASWVAARAAPPDDDAPFAPVCGSKWGYAYTAGWQVTTADGGAHEARRRRKPVFPRSASCRFRAVRVKHTPRVF
mgnify:CR=1 FL=1